jgi:hypothetical protein
MIPEDEHGFSFEDKRRTAQDEKATDATSPADVEHHTPPTPPDASGPDESDAPHLHHLTGRDRLLMCVDIMQQGAWIALGLRPDPITQDVKADLKEARDLIDCVVYLADRVSGDLDGATQRDLKNLVRDLQINYVQQLNR